MAINDRFMLPRRVRTMEQMADLLEAEQTELTQTQRVVEALENQLTISTSTFLLHRHERIFDIPINTEESLEVRRARVLAKLNTRGTTTVKAIQEMVQIVTGRAGDVLEHFDQYSFSVIVHLLFPDATTDLQELINQIDEIKPAHLVFDTVGAVQPVVLQNENQLTFYRMALRLRVNNFGEGSVYLDGRQSLDGTWLLTQLFTKGISFQRFTATAWARNPSGQAHSLAARLGVHTGQLIRCRGLQVFGYGVNNLGVAEILLDGKLPLDGSWKLAQTYSKGLALRGLQCALWLQNPQRVNNALILQSAACGRNSASTAGCYNAAGQNRAGLNYEHLRAASRFKNQQRAVGYVTADTMYYLDGSTQLAGNKKLNADIIRSEV